MGPEDSSGTARHFTGVVNHHGHQESRIFRHVMQPPRREMPFAAEVTLGSLVCVN
jgi:hypothetical protein